MLVSYHMLDTVDVITCLHWNVIFQTASMCLKNSKHFLRIWRKDIERTLPRKESADEYS